ncbi:MAG TPA: metallophosphoesterase family protein [Thermomicrobiales bacterium]|nr:metallophosphoesterase family protein [Thermomicrobiales bacterium]
MKIAVMSDIHGFAPAFEAVLADLEHRDVEQLIVAGDLFEGGPDPRRVLQLLRLHDARCVYGNTDRDMLDAGAASSGSIAWTREQIGAGGLAFLRDLPFSIRVRHPAGNAGPASELLVVHANPTDVERHLSPNASDREINEILGEELAKTIAFGHLHVSYVRQVGDRTLVDVSAVGNPRDGDLRPRYVVFEAVEGGGWDPTWHYVDYPLEETRGLMETSGMPDWQEAYRRLESARYNRPI